MTELLNKHLADALIDALTLEWRDNGNIMADAVREACVMMLAEAMEIDTDGVWQLVDRRVMENQ